MADEQPKQYDGHLAEIVEIQPRKTGMFGSIIQVMCKIMDGKDKGRVIRRNISGKAKVGDMIRLGDTSREDKPINVK
ncbi:MAG: 30S ribosomal protein S28e [Candidatus Micrarchaeota archaeon]|nr:30S ribosomal protein S28e [Candidatus Micrarchaeota archaeon]